MVRCLCLLLSVPERAFVFVCVCLLVVSLRPPVRLRLCCFLTSFFCRASIVMAPASTSAITGSAVDRHFAEAVRSRGAMVTTEISQVPLSGVERLLAVARERRLLTMLDVDVPPSVAVSEAGLGSLEQVTRVVRASDVVKPTLVAALELLQLLDPKGPKATGEEPLPEIAQRLQRLLGCQLVALTDGGRGAGMATKEHSCALPVFPVKSVVDATGAGDGTISRLARPPHFELLIFWIV